MKDRSKVPNKKAKPSRLLNVPFPSHPSHSQLVPEWAEQQALSIRIFVIRVAANNTESIFIHFVISVPSRLQFRRSDTNILWKRRNKKCLASNFRAPIESNELPITPRAPRHPLLEKPTSRKLHCENQSSPVILIYFFIGKCHSHARIGISAVSCPARLLRLSPFSPVLLSSVSLTQYKETRDTLAQTHTQFQFQYKNQRKSIFFWGHNRCACSSCCSSHHQLAKTVLQVVVHSAPPKEVHEILGSFLSNRCLAVRRVKRPNSLSTRFQPVRSPNQMCMAIPVSVFNN